MQISFEFILCWDHIKMSLIKTKLIETNYPEVWRVFISGSSSAGKTYFAKQLLASKLFDVKRIYYYHPDIHESSPIDWCNDLNIDIIWVVCIYWGVSWPGPM